MLSSSREISVPREPGSRLLVGGLHGVHIYVHTYIYMYLYMYIRILNKGLLACIQGVLVTMAHVEADGKLSGRPGPKNLPF